jgi:hypothetical protein
MTAIQKAEARATAAAAEAEKQVRTALLPAGLAKAHAPLGAGASAHGGGRKGGGLEEE